MHTSITQNCVPFSQSKLWDMQSSFYKDAGIDAWNDKIPYKITNNLTIAHAHANVIMRFFQEYASRQCPAPSPTPKASTLHWFQCVELWDHRRATTMPITSTNAYTRSFIQLKR